MTALSDFRAAPGTSGAPPAPRGRSRAAKAPWKPLTLDRLGHGVVLSWDQSIRKTAWCLLARDGAGCRVLDAGMCPTRATQGKITWADRLPDQTSVFRQARDVLRRLAPLHPELAVAHESPPQGGGRVVDPFSSALASAALWNACEAVGLTPTLLANQSAKLLLTGNRKATKAEVGRAIRALEWLDGAERLTNEDKRDAAAVGLKHLELRRGA
jgi:Holliday junction resolvasome RuvABC endonuclease subunit